MAEFLVKRGTSASYEEGDIVVVKSDLDIEVTWAEMLIRQTHNIGGIGFNATLYNKYYDRLRITPINRYLVKNPTANFRDANLLAGPGERYVDRAKMAFTKPLQSQVRNDIATYYGSLALEHCLCEKSLTATWLWGTREERDFLLVHVPDAEFADDQAIQELASPERDLEGNITRRRNHVIDFRKSKETDLELDRTIQEFVLSPSSAGKSKDWYADNLVGNSGLSLSSTFMDVLDSGEPLPNRFYLSLTADIIGVKT